MLSQEVGLPTKTALNFISEMNKIGYSLELTIDSLLKNVDPILMDGRLFSKSLGNNILSKRACELSAYIGEVIVREFDAFWSGSFSIDNIGANYYGMDISLGELHFNPCIYPFYTFDQNGKFNPDFPEFLDKELLSKISFICPHKTQSDVVSKFIHDMEKMGYKLDLSIESLKNNVDSILKDSRVFSSEFGRDLLAKRACELSIYIGEVLNKEFGSHWGDFFSIEHMGANYYGMYIQYNEFTFNPCLYLYYIYDKGGDFDAWFPEYIEKEFIGKIQ